jgi:hypothetical protein
MKNAFIQFSNLQVFILLWSVLLSTICISENVPTKYYTHAFHTSITKIEQNVKEKTFEVSIRVFTDDLETALSKEQGHKQVRIENNDKNDVFVDRYIKKVFKVFMPNGKPIAYQYIGKELEKEATWIYIEIPNTQSVSKYKIRNSVLLDIYEDQVNIVNISENGQKKSFIYNVKEQIHGIE